MESHDPDRVLTLEGCLNIRDLGGYKTLDGKLTRWKTILRADNLDKLPDSSQQKLMKYGVKTVIDLRDPWETERFPNVFAQSKAIHYVNCPIFASEGMYQKLESVSSIGLAYMTILEQCQPQIKAALNTVMELSSDGCTVIHCSAGKDRTGIIAALLLSVAHVHPETIAEDYALSQQLLAERIQGWRLQAIQGGRDMERFENDVSSRPQTMLDTLHYLKSELGGVDTYLRSIGIANEAISDLRKHIVA